MEVFNLKKCSYEDVSYDEYEFNSDIYILKNKAKNNIIMVSANDYRCFPKDELGFNKQKVISLLQYFKPATKAHANMIANYYKVCPFCKREIDIINENNSLIIDVKSDFNNIKKMTFDIYNSVVCCSNEYRISFSKLSSTKEKVDYFEKKLKDDVLVVVEYKNNDVTYSIYLHDLLSINFDDKLDCKANKLKFKNIDIDIDLKLRLLDNDLVFRDIYVNNLYFKTQKDSEIEYNNNYEV